jgi:hypothetical protein
MEEVGYGRHNFEGCISFQTLLSVYFLDAMKGTAFSSHISDTSQ